MIPVDKPADTRPTRQQCSVAVDPIGWRLVLGELVTHVPVDTLDAAVRAAAAAAAATGADGAGHLRVDLTDRRVVLGLQDRATAAVTTLDLGLARRISAALDAIDLPTTPGEGTAAPQTIEIAIDALDIPAVRPFWRAVTGYAADPQPPDLPPGALVDPLHRGPVIWFQQMDRPRHEHRNRIHIDDADPPEHARARIDAALAAGGRLVSAAAAPAFWVLADPEGNEVCVCTWEGRD